MGRGSHDASALFTLYGSWCSESFQSIVELLKAVKNIHSKWGKSDAHCDFVASHAVCEKYEYLDTPITRPLQYKPLEAQN